MTAGGVERRTDVVRRRARCSAAECPEPDWTVYEEGGYPHRSFGLDVVADAVAEVEVEVEGKSMAAVAMTHKCSRDTVRRWRRWVAELADPRDLQQLNARIDPDGVVVPLRPDASRAEAVLRHLARLADLLVARGVSLPSAASGLARILAYQRDKFRDVFCLTRLSPPLRADLAAVGV